MDAELKSLEFPEDLSFGFGTSSYQIEGAWNVDGKGENIWDAFVHNQPDKIADKSTGDVTCDFYHKYKDDILAMKNLGAQIYRFSLSWSRILPTGFKFKINEKGIEFYNSLINELLKHGIEPVVTLYHWDLPQTLQDLGGWTNPILTDYFYDYADIVFEHFGDRAFARAFHSAFGYSYRARQLAVDCHYIVARVFHLKVKNFIAVLTKGKIFGDVISFMYPENGKSEGYPMTCGLSNPQEIWGKNGVKKWITFNEPYEMCYLTHTLGIYPPGKTMSGIADYLAGHTILKSHAKVYHLYDQKYRPEQKGEIGISLSTNWIEPKSDSPADISAAQDLMQFMVGWFGHPIFSEKGDYPDIFKKKIAHKSKEEGFPVSRLPELDAFWIKYIKGTSDFYGLNHYTTFLGSCDEKNGQKNGPSFSKDHGVLLSIDPKWCQGVSWLNVVPWGLRKALNWVKKEYNNPIIYITENGYGCNQSDLKDNVRISYHHAYLKEILKGIREDHCQVKMYSAWTLLDNFEWNMGYTEKFGIYHVDFKDPSRKRTPRSSSEYLKHVFKHRKLPENLNDFL